jgi:hypothetical protein
MIEHQQSPEAYKPRPSLLRQLLTFRRGVWENLATSAIAAGVVMLMQPFSLALYTYSFITTLAGTLMFVIVSKFPE